jgi:hypothetical protein
MKTIFGPDKLWMEKARATNLWKLRTVSIPIRSIVWFIFCQHNRREFAVPCFNLPPDFVVVSTSLDQLGLCVEVVISHDSFEDVPDGQYPPKHDLQIEWERVLCVSADEYYFLEENYRATQKGQEQQDGEQQHQETQEGGVQTGSGGGDQPGESGEV